MFGISCGPCLNILGGIIEDKFPVGRGKAVAVEDKCVQQLSTGQRHEHPRSEPCGPVAKIAQLFEIVVAELQGPSENVDSNGYPQLVARVHCEEETCQTRPNRWRESRGQRS